MSAGFLDFFFSKKCVCVFKGKLTEIKLKLKYEKKSQRAKVVSSASLLYKILTC